MTASINWDVSDLQGSPRRERRERLVKAAVFGAALASVVISVLIVLPLFWEASKFIVEVDLAKLWDLGWFPRRNIFDLKTIIVATFIVTVIAMLVAAPLGLAAAIFLSEYATARVRKFLKPVLEILAGIPSVVLGFFALRFINPHLVQSWMESANSSGNMIAAGMGVGILTIPLMASISEDALSAVPADLRQASAGLGARKVTTTLSIVLPAALSGLAAAFIIAVSRAVGETMVVFIAGGTADSALYSHNPADGGLTMTAAMASVASGTDEVAGEGPTFQSLFFVGFMLFFVTLSLNMLANRVVRRFRMEY